MIPPAYYRSLLSAREQEGYRIMVNELLQYRSEVTLPFSVTEGDAVFRILNAVHKDHPEIFYIDYWQRYKLCGVLHQAQSTLPLRYLMDQRRAEAVLNTINNKVKRLDPVVAKQRNLKDKYYVIVRYIASSVSYKDTNSAFWDHTAAGPLIGRAAVCEGISKLFLLICQRLNLPCALVGGTLHNQPHAWNMVEPQAGDIRYLDVTGLLRLATIPEFLCPDIAYKTEQTLRKDGYILDA